MINAFRAIHPVLLKAGIIFFLLTSFFAFQGISGPLNSPDETANLFFIRQFARVGDFRVVEPLNTVAEDIIHPRAVNIVRHDLVPGSFLGFLLLYGIVAKFLGSWVVVFLTPIVATIALFFFYRLIQHIFSTRIAFWSTLLLMVHPAWIYYTSRSLFPNVLFLSLLIIGLFFLVHNIHYIRYIFISGLFIGSALTVRTSEAGWVLGVLLLLWLFNRRQVSWWGVSLFLLGLVIAFLPIFYENTQLYGHPFYNGYSQIDSEALPAAFAWHFQSKFLSTLFSILLPFGIRPLVLVQNAYSYLLWIFWWFSIPTIFGMILVLRSIIRRRMTGVNGYASGVFMFLFFYVFVTVWLILFYGSWSFQDSLLRGPTLGTSYARYWLPVYVFGLPFVVIAFDALKDVLKQGSRWVIAQMRLFRFLVIGFSVFSLLYVLVMTPESLWQVRATMKRTKQIQDIVLKKTHASAIIMTERSDKLFFPERRVIFNDPLDERKLHRILQKLAPLVPVYYFTAIADRDIFFLNENKLAPFGIAFGKGEPIDGQWLYRLQLTTVPALPRTLGETGDK